MVSVTVVNALMYQRHLSPRPHCSDTQSGDAKHGRWAVNSGAALGIVVCTVTSIGVIEVAGTERIRVMLG